MAKRKPEQESWWVEYEHPEYGTLRVAFGWQRSWGVQGVYRIIPRSVEFDLFTPPEAQEEVMAHVRRLRIQGVTNGKG